MLGIRLVVTLGILLSTAVVGLLHRWTDGAVLVSRPVTLVLFGAALLACLALALRARPWAAPEPRKTDWIAVGIAVAAGLLVLATYWGNEIGIGGDYRMHRMYAYQLLNGFPETHEPYRGVPGHYPLLAHTLIAVCVLVCGLTVHYAMLVLSVAISLGVALTAFRVAVLAGLSPLAARFFAGLLVAWGGAWAFELREFQLYLPAVQLALPFVSRNLALLLLLLAVEIALVAARGATARGSLVVAAGLVVGLLGLTRPWEFGLALLALVALVATRRSRDAAVALGIAAALSAVYWLPLAASWLELGIHATREVGRDVDLPTSSTLFLPLAPLVVLAVFDWRRMPRAIRGCIAGLVVLALLPIAALLVDASGIAERLGLQGGLLKLERLGQVVGLCVFGLAAFGLDRAADRFGRRSVGAVAAAVLLLGAVTTLRVNGYFLDGEVLFPSPRWTRSSRYVRDLAGSSFYLRHLLDDRRAVVLAPAQLGHLTASRNGVEVAWSHQAAPIWARATSGQHSEETRRLEVDAFYEQLQRGAVDAGRLRTLGARYFVWTARTPEMLPGVSHLGEIGELAGATWHLLRVDATPVSK